jgi:hypothetical protein
LIAYGLVRKQRALIAVGVLGQLFIYSITAFKTVLLSGFGLFAMWLCLRRGREYFGLWIVWGATGLIGLTALGSLWMDSPFLVSVIARRMFMVPGLLTGYYIEFFSTNPLTMMGDSSFLEPFFGYPYSLPVSRVIGNAYFGMAPDVAANANLWAYGFASFGYVGVVLFTVVLGIVLWLFDSVAAQRDLRFATLMLVMPGMALANTSLFTCLLTHGMGLVILMVYLSPVDASDDLPVSKDHRPREDPNQTIYAVTEGVRIS